LGNFCIGDILRTSRTLFVAGDVDLMLAMTVVTLTNSTYSMSSINTVQSISRHWMQSTGQGREVNWCWLGVL